MLAPILIGQYLSLVYYRRQCRAWDEVVPGMLIGRTLTEAEAAEVVKQGVTAVLDLTAEFSEAAAFLDTKYRNLPILDLTAPTQHQLHEAAAFIAEESASGTVYVHCKIGYSRSAAVVGAYLLASGQATMIDEAVEILREARPSIVIRPEVMEALRAFPNSRTLVPLCRLPQGARGASVSDPGQGRVKRCTRWGISDPAKRPTRRATLAIDRGTLSWTGGAGFGSGFAGTTGSPGSTPASARSWSASRRWYFTFNPSVAQRCRGSP